MGGEWRIKAMEDNLPETPEVNTNTNTDEVVGKTYSQAEFEKALQAEADKRVNQALAKKELSLKETLEAEKERIQKEALMSEEEKFKAQLEAEREAFEAERTEFSKVQMKAFSLEELSKQGLPASFSSFILASDEEAITANISALKEAWELELDKAITERLKGKTPKSQRTNLDNSDVLTKEAFFNLPYKQRMAMLAEDATLLEKLK